MNTIDDLRQNFEEVYEGLKNGTIDLKAAAELHNGLGKRLNLEKAQLEYYAYKETDGKKLDLEFWEKSAGKGK